MKVAERGMNNKVQLSFCSSTSQIRRIRPTAINTSWLTERRFFLVYVPDRWRNALREMILSVTWIQVTFMHPALRF